MPFSSLDPVIFEITRLPARYALAYIAGLMLGWRYVIVLSQSKQCAERPAADREVVDDLLMWIPGVILGGRLGYVIFYNLVIFLPIRTIFWPFSRRHGISWRPFGGYCSHYYFRTPPRRSDA